MDARRASLRLRLAFVLMLLGSALVGGGPEAASPAPDCTGPAVPLPEVCGAHLAPPTISCAVPRDVEGGLRQPNLNVVQRATDLFSWQNLIALHWPALPGVRGEPDPRRPLGAAGPVVWETWKSTTEVFRQDHGAPIPPAPWEAPEVLPAACRTVTKVLVFDEKVDDQLDAVVQPTYADGALPGTLTDQAGRRVRYEIRMNRTAFDFIVAGNLWDGNVQRRTKEAVSFPAGSQIAKAAWRELGTADPKRFQSTAACVCESGPDGLPVDCQVKTVGLVGFHLMTKTPSAPQWIWSTFEQVDNVDGPWASFHNANCNTVDCPPNRQRPAGLPNQVTRVIPIPHEEPNCALPGRAVDDVARLNTDLRNALRPLGTPLAHYELISTQWPELPASGAPKQPATVFDVLPTLLGNTTLETYIQDTSSCMGCHAVAGLDRDQKWVSADFTFTLNDAYPNPNTTPTNPIPDQVPAYVLPIPAPSRPVTPWDEAHWTQIGLGYQLALRTYESLPAFVGSKLHCSSCHLGGGRDPESAWWVGMRRIYPTPEKLYDRINQCFQRSENGAAICGPDSSSKASCLDSAPMQGLVTYMDWLDEQWRERHGTTLPPNGFPCLPGPASVDFVRGAKVYLQKCAFCHNSEGQGRYESDSYYRPAVWGDRSYNADAGFGKNLEYLAAFLHANMPYGNGGALTDQEAWDVAYFLDQKPRPGKTSSTGLPPKPPIVCPQH